MGKALSDVCIFLREIEAERGELPKHIGKALKILDARSNKLREKREARRSADLCACGISKTTMLVCNGCWEHVPKALVEDFRQQADQGKRTAAIRRIMLIAIARGQEWRKQHE